MSVSPLPESESVLVQPPTIAAAPSLETDPALNPETLLPVGQPVLVDVVVDVTQAAIENLDKNLGENWVEADLSMPGAIVTKAGEDSTEEVPTANDAEEAKENSASDRLEPNQLDPNQLEPNGVTGLSVFQEQKNQLTAEIAALQQQRDSLTREVSQLQSTLGQLVPEALQELRERKRNLQEAIERLERRVPDD